MTTSFFRTREQFRDLVLRKLRKLGVDQTTSNEDATLVYEAMDLRLKELHKYGILWRKVTGTVTSALSLVSGTATVTAPTDLLFPIKVMVRQSGTDYPVDIVGHLDYSEIAGKTKQGIPEKVFLMGSTLYFWPVPNQNLTASLVYEKIIDDTAASTAPDVDVSFLRSLKDMVAYDLADAFYVEEARMQRLKSECMEAEIMMRKLNAPFVDYSTTQVDYF